MTEPQQYNWSVEIGLVAHDPETGEKVMRSSFSIADYLSAEEAYQQVYGKLLDCSMPHFMWQHLYRSLGFEEPPYE